MCSQCQVWKLLEIHRNTVRDNTNTMGRQNDVVCSSTYRTHYRHEAAPWFHCTAKMRDGMKGTCHSSRLHRREWATAGGNHHVHDCPTQLAPKHLDTTKSGDGVIHITLLLIKLYWRGNQQAKYSLHIHVIEWISGGTTPVMQQKTMTP